VIPLIRSTEIEAFLARRAAQSEAGQTEVTAAVSEIIDQVRCNGDAALIALTERFDGPRLAPMQLRVSEAEIDEAVHAVGDAFMKILGEAAENIRSFAAQSLPVSRVDWRADGTLLGEKIVPLERVAVYAPGGRAAYPSSLLMGAVPARAAGVQHVVTFTPPAADGSIHAATLAAARTAGVDQIFRVGGAQSIAAAAFGTETVESVDKIVGPGNAWVAEAKRQVFGQVGIDMVAGPSEVVILADATANPAYIAADLLAQAEHDPLASSILITTEPAVAEVVRTALRRQIKTLSRRTIIMQAFKKRGAIILVDSRAQGLALVNRLAPEHLGLHIRDALNTAGAIRNAGAIFLGNHAPEAVGDYWAGPNHILPTAGTARFSSPLGMEDFIKRQSLISTSPQAIQTDGKKIIRFAEKEGLDAHANAIRIRMV